MRILHIASVTEWAAAQAVGSYRGSTRDAGLAQIGFVHLSTAAQLSSTLANHYSDADLSEYVLLVVDPDICERAGSRLKWELAPSIGQNFPHIYGPIPVAAVVAELVLTRAGDGSAVLPDLSGLDVVTHSP